jgi:hypothetical protein
MTLPAAVSSPPVARLADDLTALPGRKALGPGAQWVVDEAFDAVRHLKDFLRTESTAPMSSAESVWMDAIAILRASSASSISVPGRTFDPPRRRLSADPRQRFPRKSLNEVEPMRATIRRRSALWPLRELLSKRPQFSKFWQLEGSLVSSRLQAYCRTTSVRRKRIPEIMK